MKIVLVFFGLLVLACVIFLTLLGYMSRRGEALGMVQGRLHKCPAKPNCVCSEYPDDTAHYIEPLLYSEMSNADTLKILKETIQELGGVVQKETDTYLAAAFSSTLFGFVDDLEGRIDSRHNVLHIRSASRVGYSDLGLNTRRTERIRDLFYKKTR
jgi:uncharacterized protein (DUF1499 family)